MGCAFFPFGLAAATVSEGQRDAGAAGAELPRYGRGGGAPVASGAEPSAIFFFVTSFITSFISFISFVLVDAAVGVS